VRITQYFPFLKPFFRKKFWMKTAATSLFVSALLGYIGFELLTEDLIARVNDFEDMRLEHGPIFHRAELLYEQNYYLATTLETIACYLVLMFVGFCLVYGTVIALRCLSIQTVYGDIPQLKPRKK
jgi:hypothetical protein